MDHRWKNKVPTEYDGYEDVDGIVVDKTLKQQYMKTSLRILSTIAENQNYNNNQLLVEDSTLWKTNLRIRRTTSENQKWRQYMNKVLILVMTLLKLMLIKDDDFQRLWSMKINMEDAVRTWHDVNAETSMQDNSDDHWTQTIWEQTGI